MFALLVGSESLWLLSVDEGHEEERLGVTEEKESGRGLADPAIASLCAGRQAIFMVATRKRIGIPTCLEIRSGSPG